MVILLKNSSVDGKNTIQLCRATILDKIYFYAPHGKYVVFVVWKCAYTQHK